MSEFADRLLDWWQHHGRHDLPWQRDRSPYRVWVSEIMLQQTQVATVIPYFERFMERFRSLPDLAQAELDEVLALWSGLGYYARARNLHHTARICLERHGGDLPDDPEALQALPGIGRSTAHAIVAQAWNRRAPILDGNAKRVLARHAGIEDWPGRTGTLKRLWQESEKRTPPGRAADYTQAIMDLGAGLCTPRRPACLLCPVHADCRARLEDRVERIPGRKPPRSRPHRHTTMLIIQDDRGRVLLERRPASGIWGGLWCLPETSDPAHHELPDAPEPPPDMDHQFTHFKLTIQFKYAIHTTDLNALNEREARWFGLDQALSAGLPRPVRTLLQRMREPGPGPRG